jgi:hypothetical protein
MPPKRETAMAKANVRLMEGTLMDKMKARVSALLQRERAFEKGSILRLRKSESTGFGMIEAIEPEAELFAVAEQVDLAEKAFHDALARRNEAQIAYLREPNIKTREARGNRAGNSERRGPMAGYHSGHDGNRAQAEGVLCFHGRQARRQHCRRYHATLSTGNRRPELNA